MWPGSQTAFFDVQLRLHTIYLEENRYEENDSDDLVVYYTVLSVRV